MQNKDKSRFQNILSAVTYYIAILPCLFFMVYPVRFIYMFSDILAFLLYYVLRYRRKIVRDNLQSSFPEKSEQEIKTIEKQFYKHLSDVFAEYLLLFKASTKDLDKRLEYKNLELLDELHAKGKDVILVMGDRKSTRLNSSH